MRTCFSSIISVIILSCLFLIHSNAVGAKGEDNSLFFALSTTNGLLDNNVLQMMQLPDGRMVFMTSKGINIYNERKVQTLQLDTTCYSPIKGYKGYVHLYADNDNHLWIKDMGKVYCINLNKLKWIKAPLKGYGDVTDMFVDSNHRLWFVRGHELASDDGNIIEGLSDGYGDLQDVDADPKHIYTFYSSGTEITFHLSDNLKDKSTVLTARPLSKKDDYASTSMIVKTSEGQFFQIKTGKKGSAFFGFNQETHKYKVLYSCGYTLHTLNMASAQQALISSERGYLMFNFNVSNTPREITELSLPDGTSLVTGINTVCRDKDGGIWLGTYHNGIIYVSPYLGLFFKAEKPWWKQTRTIILIAILVVIAVLAVLLYRHRQNKALPIENKTATNSEEEPSTEGTTVLSEEPELLQRARKIIEEHISDSGYGVEQLASELFMERTGLYKKITTLTNETPVTFIRNIRLDKAASLIREGTMPINEVAERTGFSSPGYFTKCFKQRFGMKPSEYK